MAESSNAEKKFGGESAHSELPDEPNPLTTPKPKSVSFLAHELIRDIQDEDGDSSKQEEDDEEENVLSPLPSFTERPNLRDVKQMNSSLWKSMRMDLSSGRENAREQFIQEVMPRSPQQRRFFSEFLGDRDGRTKPHAQRRNAMANPSSDNFVTHMTTTVTEILRLNQRERPSSLVRANEEDAPPSYHREYRIRARCRNDPTLFVGASSWQLTQVFATAISNYMNWTYRSSFCLAILSAYVLYLLLMVLFALCIYGSGRVQPECIFVGSSNFTDHFMDAMHLSWTTLSTVGYGITGPKSPSATERCFFINVLMAFESFVGVLFGGFVSAIMIGKVARFQSIAQIRFSDAICVRYGTAVLMEDEEEDEQYILFGGNGDGDDTTSPSQNGEILTDSAVTANMPFPILEFRLINLLSRERGGEILNATISVVASVTENDCESTNHIANLRVKEPTPPSSTKLVGMATETTTKAVKMVGAVGTRAVTTGTKAAVSTAKYTGAALLGVGKRAKGSTGSLLQQLIKQIHWTPKDDIIGDIASRDDDNGTITSAYELDSNIVLELEERLIENFERNQAALLHQRRLSQDYAAPVVVDEGNATLAPPRTYHKLEVETDMHPYLKRVWNIRHVLNERSPILSHRARHMIERNHGSWPEALNNAERIREHLRFNDIIVSFTGTANASGTNVYAQNVYDHADVHIGYTFLNVVKMFNHRIVVDETLLNDVVEQIGGGAEPLPES